MKGWLHSDAYYETWWWLHWAWWVTWQLVVVGCVFAVAAKLVLVLT